MLGPYTHGIDPILFDVGGVHLWWYGLGFALGFLELQLFLRRGGGQLRLSPREVWSLSLYMTVGVLVGGRALADRFLAATAAALDLQLVTADEQLLPDVATGSWQTVTSPRSRVHACPNRGRREHSRETGESLGVSVYVYR